MPCSDSLLQQLAAALEGKGDYVTAACEAGCTGFADCKMQAELSYMSSSISSAVEKLDGTYTGINTMFLLFSAYLVFMMQLGFAMLTAGCVRSKNAMNIFLKNILDACIGGVGFYTLGYGFAFGYREGYNDFIGVSDFALSDTTIHGGWASFFFQWSFAAATTTIVSGAVAERCSFTAYLGYALFLSSFVYPVVVHWVWSAQGWLSAFYTGNSGYAKVLETGAVDFAGSGVVHMVGGWAALMGSYMVGPRMGRFNADGSVNEMPGHNATLVVMGTFLLWFGWYGFNPGSNLMIGDAVSADVVSRVAVTTTMAASMGGIVMLVWKYAWTRTWDTLAVCNGVLAGLVGVTAGCAVIPPWSALLVGGVAAVIFSWAENFGLRRLKIDDPVSAWALHGVVGAWGVFYVGLMASPKYMQQVYGVASYGMGTDIYANKKYGAFYGGNGRLLLANFIEILVIIAWTCGMMGLYFGALKLAKVLRVPENVEMAGLDASHHNAKLYGSHPNDDGAILVMPGGVKG